MEENQRFDNILESALDLYISREKEESLRINVELSTDCERKMKQLFSELNKMDA